MKTLILTSEEVKKLLQMDLVIKAVEKAFKEQAEGKTIMPPKIYLILEEYEGDFRAMPAYIQGQGKGGAGGAGVKWVSVYPQNPVKRELPAVMASLIYSDPETGFPLAFLAATAITDYRTGAASAIATKYLARKDSKSLGLVGCGAQAQTQLLAISRVFNLEIIRVCAQREESVKFFIKKNSSFPLKRASLEEVASCDVISTTTPVREPLLKQGWIKKGTHINAVGADAPGKQELDPEILLKAKVVVDDIIQASHSGEINVPLKQGLFKKENIYGTLGEVVAGKKKGRENAAEITLFDSTGLAIEDIATAKIIVEEARKAKIGLELKMI